DSRTMFVSGCAGQTILAFDNAGGLWKSDDGGDGQLAVSSTIKLQPQPLVFQTISSCLSATKKATFVMNGCMPFVITNVSVINNPAGAYTLLSSTKTKLAPPPNVSTALTVPDTLQ